MTRLLPLLRLRLSRTVVPALGAVLLAWLLAGSAAAQEPSAGAGRSRAAEHAFREEAAHAATGGAGHAEQFDIQEYTLHHLKDSRILDFEPFGEIQLPEIRIGPIDVSVTKHVVFLWLAAALMLAIFIPMARTKGPVYRGLHNFLEAMVVFVRDGLAVATIGKEKASTYVPYLLTLFFFILFANFLGLIPYGAAATSNWMVTGALAALTMFVVEGASVRELGPRGYVRQYVPVQLKSRRLVAQLLGLLLVGLIFVIEVISHIARIFALMVRLAANMTAGHMLILALIGLIFLFQTYFVAPPSLAGAVAVYLLEIFIALVQAFIFTILTALFIGLAVHEHH